MPCSLSLTALVYILLYFSAKARPDRSSWYRLRQSGWDPEVEQEPIPGPAELNSAPAPGKTLTPSPMDGDEDRIPPPAPAAAAAAHIIVLGNNAYILQQYVTSWRSIGASTRRKAHSRFPPHISATEMQTSTRAVC